MNSSMRLSQTFLMLMFYTVMLTGCGGAGGDSADPVVIEAPLVYVVRADLVDDEQVPEPLNRYEPGSFFVGAQLFIKRNNQVLNIIQTAYCDIRDITSSGFGRLCEADRTVRPFDIKDIAVSYDGQKIAFALHVAPPEDESYAPTWDLWLYDIDMGTLSPVLSEAIADIGDDIAPAFLPDGDLVFSSSMQRATRSQLLDEGKGQFQSQVESRGQIVAFAVHRVSVSGENLRQLTFNMSHDLDPVVLNNGRVLFSRWDNVANRNRVNLYTIAPDGHDLQMYYGAHSHEDIGGRRQFFSSQVTDSDQILVQYAVEESEQWGMAVRLVNAENYSDIYTPVYANLGATGPGQVVPEGMTGEFVFASPVLDGTQRILAGWSPCRLQDESGSFYPCTSENLANDRLSPASPLYGLWIFDPVQGTQTLVEPGRAGRIITEARLLTTRERPRIYTTVSQSAGYDSALAEQNMAQLHIRSVYDYAGQDRNGIAALADPMRSYAERPLWFLRIVKGVQIPTTDIKNVNNAHIGVSTSQLMREIVGYVPVEPDGSVKATIPALVPLDLQFVDETGTRVGPRHQNWLHFQPGESFECRGCHNNSEDTAVHGRLEAEAPSAHQGALSETAYPNTQPGLVAEVGETMAEVWARLNGARQPSVDLIFNDDWTDISVVNALASFEYRHSELSTPMPLSSECTDSDDQVRWVPGCRIVIHYPTHIEPLWSLNRQGVQADGVTPMDQTCTSCHSRTNQLDELVVPAGQLELSSSPSPQQQLQSISYRELLLNDNEVEIRDGALVDRLVFVLDGNGDPIPVLDNEGEPVLDLNDEPIFQTTVVVKPRSMNPGGAAASSSFFTTMTTEGTTVDHRGFLTDAELFLIRQWLDLGAQYYNDPFAIPD